MEEHRKYYIGLDIGTNSVGWAVTDTHYNLCRFNKKDMWGIRLFESASTAKDRREKRSARRRLSRRKDRIQLLQEIFAEEIKKIDDTFFIRLNESFLHMDDKSVKEIHPIFCDNNYTDIDFYNEYPTMYHLRKELIIDNTYHDPRLVYLALHHILKSRGHFLIPGTLSDVKDFNKIIKIMLDNIYDTLGMEFILEEKDIGKFQKVLRDNSINKTEKQKVLKPYLKYEVSSKDKEEQKQYKNTADQICKLLSGGTADLYKLVGGKIEEIENNSFSFDNSKYEDELKDVWEQVIPDEVSMIEKIKMLYDWSVLADILEDYEYISMAKVESFEKHKENLSLLRNLLKHYCSKHLVKCFFDGVEPSEEKLFKSEKILMKSLKAGNYALYIGHSKRNGQKQFLKKCGEEDFYKTVQKIIETIEPEEKDIELVNMLKRGAKNHSLLPLQRTKDNSVVPKQIHEVELKKILENASSYLPFLNEKDEDGYIEKDKIISIFNYRIPYYVGPLSNRHKSEGSNVWSVRKKEGRIYPWNFTDMIDTEKSNERFIRRMTNKCTYLIGEDVLPKNSIIYSKYMVLNEINNLKVNGKPISVELKQVIFENLFKKNKKITRKKLIQYLNELDPGIDLEEIDIAGVDTEFTTSFAPYIDFKKNVFGNKIDDGKNLAIAEDIIKWITIYGDDKKMLRNVIQNMYPGEFSEEQMKNILRLKYTGWGRFSETFLTKIKGSDDNGEYISSILEGLWKTNNNLMQLLSRKYAFQSEIEDFNKSRHSVITKVNYENVVEPLITSPANKRAIWQTIQIVEEIVKIMGCEPTKIFVEMARGGEESQKGKRTKSRKEHLIELYKKCQEDMREWMQDKNWIKEIESRDERDFNSIKLYLYYTQLGRCMYTGEKIDLNELMTKNSKWDRDHIYPQSKIKDDSIDNLVLVNKTVNSKKSNELLSYDIVKRQRRWWKMLREKNLISQKKYDRLIRTNDFTEDELTGFISRQLVETRQSCRIAADIFKSLYTSSNIVYVKAGLVSQFRYKELKVLKSRLINDYHHAKDAYLNIVVGNVYDTKFSSNPIHWINKYNINRVFDYNVRDLQKNIVWEAPEKDKENKPIKHQDGGYKGGTIELVRKTINRNNILHTEYTYCEKGELFNATIADKNENPKIRIKKGLDVEKYGGYKSPNTSYFVMIEFDGKKGDRVKNVIGLPIYIANRIPQEPNIVTEYFENVLGKKNVKVIKEKIKKNALIVVDGFPMRIRGENDKNIVFKGDVQLILDRESGETVRCIEKYLEKDNSYEPNPELDGISHEKLNTLYDVLNNKLKTVYKERPANISKKLDDFRDSFIGNKSLKEKSKVIEQIIISLRCDINTTSDLRIIGGGGNVGSIKVNKNTIGKSKIRFVNQSVTGLFEN